MDSSDESNPKANRAAPAAVANAPTKAANALGLEMAELAGLSVDEILNNKAAITMLMHYHRQLNDENASLKNDLNTAQTYVNGYQVKRANTQVGATLQALGAIFIGFGTNLLTGGQQTAAGWVMLIAGVLAQCAGLYFALKA